MVFNDTVTYDLSSELWSIELSGLLLKLMQSCRGCPVPSVWHLEQCIREWEKVNAYLQALASTLATANVDLDSADLMKKI